AQAGGARTASRHRYGIRGALAPIRARGEDYYLGAIRLAPSRRMGFGVSLSVSTSDFTSCAYSAGRPRREGNGTCLPSDSCASFGNAASSGVSKIPGAMVQTRMPLRERSRAIGRVMPTIPPLDAE